MFPSAMTKEEFLDAFVATTSAMVQTVQAKNNDYTVSDDPFDNFMAVELFGICGAETGILVRMTDKFKRITSLLGGKQQMVKDEAVEDTLDDLANYAIILKLLHKQRRQQLQPPPLDFKLKQAGSLNP